MALIHFFPMEIEGLLFADWAQAHPDCWSLLVNAPVEHNRFGQGRVERVTGDKQPVLHIHFNANGLKKFPARVFQLGSFTSLRLSPPLATRVEADLAEELAKREAELAALGEIRDLAEKYKITVNQHTAGELLPILRKMDCRDTLSETELTLLHVKGHFNVLATYHYRLYRITQDPWNLVKACSNLRRARLSRKVLELTASLNEKPTTFNFRAWAALLTTKGGAFRDIGDFDSAKNFASAAIETSPDSYHPHNLLGAIYYSEGDYDTGDSHFDRAIQLGSSVRVQDKEIAALLERSSLEEQDQIRAHLLTRDSERFSWLSRSNERI